MSRMIAMGCLGDSETFKRFWRKMTTDLAQQPLIPQLDVSLAPDARHTAGLYVDRDRQIVLKVCLPPRKTTAPGAPTAELQLAGCGK